MADHVAAGELIESAWGNQVVDQLTAVENQADAIEGWMNGTPGGELPLGWRIWTRRISATSDSAGAITFSLDPPTFSAPPLFVLCTEMFIAAGVPNSWTDIMVDKFNLTASTCRVQLVPRSGSTAPPGIAYTFFAFALGAR